jgi:hypothetical protein
MKKSVCSYGRVENEGPGAPGAAQFRTGCEVGDAYVVEAVREHSENQVSRILV